MKTLIQSSKRCSLVLVLLLAALFFAQEGFAQTQTFSTPGTFSGVNGFTAPAGVTSITVEVWGGGGAGGGGTLVNAGGGGGGAYKKLINVTVVPGTQYTITVGAGGVGNNSGNGPAGGASQGVFGATTVAANGGFGSNGSNGGAVTTGGTFNGGAGAPGTSFGHGGGGGGSAGTSSNGTTATSATGAAAVTGGGAGGNGGPSVGTNGSPGSSPGGGGGGGIALGSTTGGSGGNGKVVITWVPCTPPAAPTVSSPVNYCLNSTAIQLTATGSGLLWYTVPTGGTGSSTAPTPLTTTVGTTSYYVSQTVGCEGPRAQINVIVKGLPVASVSPANQSNLTCNLSGNGSITITPSLGSLTYIGYSVTNGIASVPLGLPAYQASPTFNTLPAGQYQIRVKDSNGCESKQVQ